MFTIVNPTAAITGMGEMGEKTQEFLSGSKELEIMDETTRISNVQRTVREKNSQRTCEQQCKENQDRSGRGVF